MSFQDTNSATTGGSNDDIHHVEEEHWDGNDQRRVDEESLVEPLNSEMINMPPFPMSHPEMMDHMNLRGASPLTSPNFGMMIPPPKMTMRRQNEGVVVENLNQLLVDYDEENDDDEGVEKGKKKKKRRLRRKKVDEEMGEEDEDEEVVGDMERSEEDLTPEEVDLTQFVCEFKPSRRKRTGYAPQGVIPKNMCSAPYKYLLRITHPLNDGFNENDFGVYLTAFDKDHNEKGQLQGGIELDYLRSNILDDETQVHYYHAQFTLTSFLNHNEKYKFNVVLDGDKKVLETPEFVLVARKNKRVDDSFWDRHLITETRAVDYQRKVRRRTGRKRKRYYDNADEVEVKRKTRSKRIKKN